MDVPIIPHIPSIHNTISVIPSGDHHGESRPSYRPKKHRKPDDDAASQENPHEDAGEGHVNCVA